MSGLPRSLPDVAEQLMGEFESVCSISRVTETVMRLSRNGMVPLVALAELARSELLAAAGSSEPAVSPTECGCVP